MHGAYNVIFKITFVKNVTAD
jgi:hypothetical protein